MATQKQSERRKVAAVFMAVSREGVWLVARRKTREVVALPDADNVPRRRFAYPER